MGSIQGYGCNLVKVKEEEESLPPIILVEGVETGLAVAQILNSTGSPYQIIVTGSASFLKDAPLPEDVGEIIIAADNDEIGINAA